MTHAEKTSPFYSPIERVSPTWIVREGERTRQEMLEELEWAYGIVDLDALTTPQIGTILGWVRERLLMRGGRCDIPGNAFITKERRLGATNRWGWRFVVHVGALGAEQDVASCSRRVDALAAKRRHYALWWYDQVRPRAKEDA